MKSIKRFILACLDVIQESKQMQAQELKKRYFQR